MRLFMSTSCQTDRRVIRAFFFFFFFFDVEKPFLFSDLAGKAANSENKKAVQRQKRQGLAFG